MGFGGGVIRVEELTVSPTSAGERRLNVALGEMLGEQVDGVRNRASLLLTELLADRSGAAAAEELLTVRVFVDPDTLRVEIHDGGHGAVLRRIRQAPGVAGRGWNPHLMNRVADRWGLVSDQAGAWVWFELTVPGSRS